MLSNDQFKISQFRDKVSAYRTSTISASQLIDTFFSLFDVPSADLGKLIKELAEIYESDTKRSDLLKAWNDWRAINEDYPTLPGPSGILPGSSAATSVASSGGGRRVLKLKSSTQQSSRSAVSRHGSWGNAAAANPFPPIPPAASTSASANRAGAGRVCATPWLTPSASTSSRPSPATSRPSSKPPHSRTANTNTANSDAFPALPTAPKPNTTMFGYASGAVRWNQNSTPGVNPWANGTSSNASANQGFATASSENENEAFAEGGGGGGGKKKGNKGKKQTLYKFG